MNDELLPVWEDSNNDGIVFKMIDQDTGHVCDVFVAGDALQDRIGGGAGQRQQIAWFLENRDVVDGVAAAMIAKDSSVTKILVTTRDFNPGVPKRLQT